MRAEQSKHIEQDMHQVHHEEVLAHVNAKVGSIHIQLDHVQNAKIHLLATALTKRRFLLILSTMTFRYMSDTPMNIFKIIYFVKWKEL